MYIVSIVYNELCILYQFYFTSSEKSINVMKLQSYRIYIYTVIYIIRITTSKHCY